MPGSGNEPPEWRVYPFLINIIVTLSQETKFDQLKEYEMYRKLYPLLVNSQQRYYNLTTRTRKSVCGIQVQLGRKHMKVIKPCQNEKVSHS